MKAAVIHRLSPTPDHDVRVRASNGSPSSLETKVASVFGAFSGVISPARGPFGGCASALDA